MRTGISVTVFFIEIYLSYGQNAKGEDFQQKTVTSRPAQTNADGVMAKTESPNLLGGMTLLPLAITPVSETVELNNDSHLIGATAEQLRKFAAGNPESTDNPGNPLQKSLEDQGTLNLISYPKNIPVKTAETSKPITTKPLVAPVVEEEIFMSTLAKVRLDPIRDLMNQTKVTDDRLERAQQPTDANWPGWMAWLELFFPTWSVPSAVDSPSYKPGVHGLRTTENKRMLTENTDGNKTYKRIIQICGYPPYNNRNACRELNYSSDPLSECEEGWGMIVFGTLVGIGGAAIVSVNGLIVVVVLRNPNMRSGYDTIKVSLALDDAIIGVLIFASVFPNMVWVRNQSEYEFWKYAKEDINSPTAIIVGSVLNVTMQASLLHLCFLSVERFMAIKWPFWHIRRKRGSIVITLVVIWLVSIALAFVPALFPEYFEYEFQPALLIHMLTMKEGPDADGTSAGMVYTVITLVVPYLIMVVVCLVTAVVSYQKLRSNRRSLGKDHAQNSNIAGTKPPRTNGGQFETIHQTTKKRLPPEIAVFITIVIMICVFTFTLLPFFVVLALLANGLLSCEHYTIPYVTGFYFGLLNSFANGVIYSVRDPAFRSAVKRLFNKDNSKTVTVPPNAQQKSLCNFRRLPR